jgi:hypothetical protein
VSDFDANTLRKRATTILRRGTQLERSTVEKRAAWLAGACEKLRNPLDPLGKEARDRIPLSAGLSQEMVSWALETSLAPVTQEALVALERGITPPHPRALRARPGQLCAVVLAGNVFTAAIRALSFPLLLGWPVLAKASSHDHVFAELFELALRETDVQLADALGVITFAADDDEALSGALLEQADAVSVYGSDATLNVIRSSLSATVSFMGHGHGLGAALVGGRALVDESGALEVARALALDIAAYDQRGCLSPHVIWVERGARVSSQEFAERVFQELAALSVRMPRGPLSAPDASAQLHWRGVGTLRGELFEGEGFSVAYEEDGALRVSPGQRNVQVIAIDRIDQAADKLAPLGVHLKCLGLAGVDAQSLASKLAPRLAPRLCPIGTMQTPALEALHDGQPAWEGLVRWIDG